MRAYYRHRGKSSQLQNTLMARQPIRSLIRSSQHAAICMGPLVAWGRDPSVAQRFDVSKSATSI